MPAQQHGTPGTDERISFRPLAASDLPLLHGWRNLPHVREWYYDETPGETITSQRLEEKYRSRITGEDPTRAFIIRLDGAAIGYIQYYRIQDHSEYAASVGEAEDAAGVDLFIGEPQYVHKGLGPRILRAFLREVVFAETDTVSCIIGPEPKNRAAIRAYEKAGFTYLKIIRVPGEPEPEYLMRLSRSDLLEQQDS